MPDAPVQLRWSMLLISALWKPVLARQLRQHHHSLRRQLLPSWPEAAWSAQVVSQIPVAASASSDRAAGLLWFDSAPPCPCSGLSCRSSLTRLELLWKNAPKAAALYR